LQRPPVFCHLILAVIKLSLPCG